MDSIKSWIASRKKWISYALVAILGGIVIVFLTGCSTNSVDGSPTLDLSSLSPRKVDLPDPPPKLSNCYREASVSGRTADALIADRIKREKEFEACLKEWPRWYRGVQEANGTMKQVAEKK